MRREGRYSVCGSRKEGGQDMKAKEKTAWGREGRGEVAGIEQVCREEIRVLQVSLQGWYIDMRE